MPYEPGSTVPDPRDLARAKVRWASRYVDVGWRVFVLGRDKTPLPNCAECHNADWNHIREDCTCMTCHGFYAATRNLDLIDDMVRRHPDGWLAVRTGAASRLLVLDFEAAPNAEGITGLDTLDQWEMWTGHELPDTLKQRTQSGGIHMLYRLSPGTVVKSRNRVLPQCDVKAEGGYVAVPTPGRPEREWLRPPFQPGDPHEDVREAPRELLNALEKLRGRASRREIEVGVNGNPPSGYDYETALHNGCPGGFRDEFFNDLLFRHRKIGLSREGVEKLARMHWERCQQPPATEWYMPWEHVEYKLERVWRTVEPNPPGPRWRPDDHVVGTTDEGQTIVRQGNVAIVRSDW